MVYKFKIYKLRENAEYGKYGTNHNAKECFCVNSNELNKSVINKTVYFDILNECFVEHDKTVDAFEEFPSFFRLDNQLFYGIYGQPRVLKYHYSEARDCNDSKEYMRKMNISMQNFLDVCSLLYNRVDEEQRYVDIWWSGTIKFCFKTKEEAISTITKVLNENYDCNEFCKVKTPEHGTATIGGYSYSNRLYIHKPEFPVFYTDNILELTIPIAESVSTLAKDVAKVFANVQYMLSLLSCSTQMLMAKRLDDRYSALLKENMTFLSDRNVPSHKRHKEAMDFARKETEIDYILYKNHYTQLSHGHSMLSNAISESKIDAMYKELDSRIKNIKTDNLSLNTLLDISNDFKMLESKIDK